MLQELEHLSSLVTNVYDLRIIFSIGNALCESLVLSRQELAFARIFAKVFERTIDRSAGLFSMTLDHCVRNQLITKTDYVTCKRVH